MFQHDFRRLALARDLLADARGGAASANRFSEPDPPEAARRGDARDHAAADKD
jgi:hypothetical protein